GEEDAAQEQEVGAPRSPRGAPAIPYGVVVDSVNVIVLLYEPVRSASVESMCCLKPIVTGSLETGAVQALLDSSTTSDDGRENDPLVMWPGSEYVSAASPAVEMTLALVDAV